MSARLLTDSELRDLLEMSKRATPTPWHVRLLDDAEAMTLISISTRPGTGNQERWPDFNATEIVAATLIQSPRYVDVNDSRWQENAEYIAAAATFLPSLVAELLELRRGRRE